ncbi:MAG: hypothetical protein QG622_814 [Actinomycetota bacterium]|nr:hypothetical protein [Actinomycetota bacterium]
MATDDTDRAARSDLPDANAWATWPTPSGVPGPEQLGLLVSDAAERATALLAGGPATAGDPLVDAVRMLATPAGARHVAAAERLTGIPEDDLRRLVLAHRHGGDDGVAAALAGTPCDAEDLEAAAEEVRGRRAFASDDLTLGAGEIVDVTAGIRLRLGPDRRWYPFTLARARWWPAPGAHPSAATAYQAAVRTRSQRRAST